MKNKVIDDLTTEDVMDALMKWTSDELHSPSLLISLDNGSYHLGYYAGMGSSDSASIDNYSPLYKTTIEQLLRKGQMEASGRAFTLYPGSDRFKKLTFKKAT